MISALILDIDNCISDDQWRLSFINPSSHMKKGRDYLRCFDDYNSLSGFDKCHKEHFAAHIKVAPVTIFVTSRPEKYRALTVVWLQRNGLSSNPLLMRHNSDYRKSVITKSELIDNYLTAREDIARSQVIAFDDHPEVVAAYQKLKIDTVYHAINERDHNH